MPLVSFVYLCVLCGYNKSINHKGHKGTQRKAKSKLSRMLFGPAFDHYFLFRVKLDGVTALAMHDSEEAVFPAAEREIGHGCGDADVDADISGRSFVTEASRRCAAGSK